MADQFSGTITSLKDIYSMPYGQPFCVYRGHANAEWKVVPSLFRSTSASPTATAEQYEAYERTAVSMFFEKAAPYLSTEYNGTNYWHTIIAQHYGVPTRLLDFSADPHIALYFAVCDERFKDVDGSIVHMRPQNGAWGFMRSQNGGDPAVILGDREMVLLDPPTIDTRISAQRSRFLLAKSRIRDGAYFALEDREEVKPKPLIYRIPKENKARLALELSFIGIDECTVFPGAQGVGAVIRGEMKRTQF